MHAGRMSEEEYMERVSGLFEKVLAESAATESEAILLERYRDAEFDLNVEYRLGPDFPVERRKALRAAYQRVQERAEELKKKYLSGNLKEKEFVDLMQAATAGMAEAYGSVLTPEEMTAFFGHGEGAYKLPFLSDELE
jgi:hypothetical protein